jgi:hypothetical protein
MASRGGAGALKIVVTGPFAAGKTTFIRTISDVTVLSTERDVSDATKAVKPETTVAMDFGRITIDRDLVLALFGTPGQERFDFMWEILADGMLGYVVLVDPSRESGVAEVADILSAFRGMSAAPYVVAVNRTPPDAEDVMELLRTRLAVPSDVQVVGCDATDKASVKAVLLALLDSVLAQARPVPILQEA